MKVFEYESVVIKLGENALENTQLIKDALPNYTWIHLKSFPSGHVIIETEETTPALLSHAASICLQGTKQKKMKNVVTSVTSISNLYLTDKMGEVEFKSNRKVLSIKIS